MYVCMYVYLNPRIYTYICVWDIRASGYCSEYARGASANTSRHGRGSSSIGYMYGCMCCEGCRKSSQEHNQHVLRRVFRDQHFLRCFLSLFRMITSGKNPPKKSTGGPRGQNPQEKHPGQVHMVGQGQRRGRRGGQGRLDRPRGQRPGEGDDRAGEAEKVGGERLPRTHPEDDHGARGEGEGEDGGEGGAG